MAESVWNTELFLSGSVFSRVFCFTSHHPPFHITVFYQALSNESGRLKSANEGFYGII
jgi:hypothetical protein